MAAVRAACRSVLAASFAVATLAHGEPTWQISPPVIKGQAPEKGESAQPAPRKKEEARLADELLRLPIDRIYVEGRAESDGKKEPPMTKEEKFATALNAGNPEVNGGKIRHGMFYDGGLYWAPEPLSFIYYNIVNRFKD
jgi:hypothetical protein